MEILETQKFIKDVGQTYIVFKPTTFSFKEYEEKGVLITDGSISTYIYPLNSDASNPIKFINEALTKNNKMLDFIIKSAYLLRQDILIDKIFISWDEWENLLTKCSYYIQRKNFSNAEIQEIIRGVG